MGREIYCQLCGVIFNISRIRTRHEPCKAAWSSVSAESDLTWVGCNARDHDPCDDDCLVIYRGRGSPEAKKTETDLNLRAEDGLSADNPTNADGGESSREAEYAAGGVSGGVQQTKSSENDTHKLDASSTSYMTEFDTNFQPLSVIEDLDDGNIGLKALDDLRRDYEHIAGPNCQYKEGYNGHNISLAEMRGCSTVQCLVRKIDGWEPLDDDEDFEKYSSCCLTGLARELDPIWSNRFSPVRHGTSEWVSTANDSDNTLRSVEVAMWVGVPFHPTCFELFRRASIKDLGRVATEELMNLRDYYCKYPERVTQPFCQRSEDVINSFEEGCWQHNRGHEYLVANPIFIPTFREICDAARRVPADFSVQESPFSVRGGIGEGRSSSADTFLKLPSEILQTVVGYLGSRDIASLRLTSRAFQHLPISMWHRLLVEELPFIYEAWAEDAQPYNWALVDADRLQKLNKRGEQYEKQREDKIEALRAHEPGSLAIWMDNSPNAKPWHVTDEYTRGVEACMEENRALQPLNLPYDKTNWYQLYRDIAMNWKDLKGLQNRKRIWKDVTEIISHMMEYAETEIEEGEEEEGEGIY